MLNPRNVVVPYAVRRQSGSSSGGWSITEKK
jgi:hypothetical protein